MGNGDRFAVGFVCMILCVILPLVVLLRRERRSRIVEVLSILALYAVWYLTNASLHEGAHYLGCILTGVRITEVRLIPHFWQGDFVAYVNTPKMTWGQGALTAPAPYVLDLVSLLIGAVLLRSFGKKGIFLRALILTLFCLRPLFDIVSNFAGFVVWRQGDFKEMANLFGSATAFGAGLAISWIAIAVALYLVQRAGRQGHRTALHESDR